MPFQPKFCCPSGLVYSNMVQGSVSWLKHLIEICSQLICLEIMMMQVADLLGIIVKTNDSSGNMRQIVLNFGSHI